jgi:hypothetical protein
MPSQPPPVPYQNTAPSATTAVQQYAQEYQNYFLQNQTAYRNIVLSADSKANQHTWKLAQVMARAIERYRGVIPFGSLMARCRRESGFDPGVTEKARYSQGEYGVGPWGITGAWDTGGKPYGLTKAQAYEPNASTKAVVQQMVPIHEFIITVAPATKQDLVFYSWMLFCNHASGPGYYEAARQYVKTNVEPRVPRKKVMVLVSATPGLGGNVARCWKRFNKITLQGMMATAWMAAYGYRLPIDPATGEKTKYTIYSSQDGAWRLMVGALDACVWERRRDAVLAGKVLVSETRAMLAQAIAQVNNSGQGAILEAFKAHGAGWSRANDAVQETRQDKFKGAAQAGVDVKNQQMQQNANTIRLANAAELTGLLAPGGTIMVYNEKSGLWEP